MLHLLLAALLITWSGIGAPVTGAIKPAVIARPAGGEVPNAPVQFGLTEGRSPVPGDWWAKPEDSIFFTDIDPMGYYTVTDNTFALPAYQFSGPVTISASYAGQSASLMGYVYPSISVSCYLSFLNGVRFDGDGVARPAARPQDSDIYQVGPENGPRSGLHGCTGAFVDPRATRYPIHVPFGGTVIRARSGVYVGDISFTRWRDDFTILPKVHPGDIVLFRTADGRYVKLLVYPCTGGALSGAYALASFGQDFGDYQAEHPRPVYPHAIFYRVKL